MNLKLVLAGSLLAAMTTVTYSQTGNRPTNAPKPSKAEIQRVIQIVSGDKSKTQQYCEIGKLNREMEQADQKKDTRKVEALGQQADALAQKIGPEFVRFMDALDRVDDNSSEGKDFAAAAETLDKLCAPR